MMRKTVKKIHYAILTRNSSCNIVGLNMILAIIRSVVQLISTTEIPVKRCLKRTRSPMNFLIFNIGTVGIIQIVVHFLAIDIGLTGTIASIFSAKEAKVILSEAVERSISASCNAGRERVLLINIPSVRFAQRSPPARHDDVFARAKS